MGSQGPANARLARLLPKGLGKRGRCVAIALSALPYHGTGKDPARRGLPQQSPMWHAPFFTYATAYAVVRGRRYPLALGRVRAKQTMDHVVRPLLERLVVLGFLPETPAWLARGFDSGGGPVRGGPPSSHQEQTRQNPHPGGGPFFLG